MKKPYHGVSKIVLPYSPEGRGYGRHLDINNITLIKGVGN